ncbi:3-hydroxyisobutyryl-CoA hydrolase [Podila minutissima]|uniref:3-hydroxyisobutyryl-CoA hydrolase n=1 Tax=Podila minutissima TaxID=64525 RepID=A0A9P5SR77_9FUNG|nr:3-hydroxyisobutyryl-CoA hydrolase [Podila minutissima]KAF9336571.1 3-hydroxyisobutyryl-CoA hydrolase [Podila minutissima]
MGYPPEKNDQDAHPYMNGSSSKEKQQDHLYDDQVSSSSRPSSVGYSGGSKANGHYRPSFNGSPSSSLSSSPSTSRHPPPLPSRQPSVMTTRQNTFREGSRPPLPPKDTYDQVCRDLASIYKKKIRPLETTYNFEGFHSAPLTDSDISAKPMVLLLGQYSTGKTTFIKHLIEGDYPGSHIGVEPTTDRFVAVMNGTTPRVIPGNAAAVSADLPFRGLDRFGQAFLSRFQVSQCPSPLLENMTLIDTPGILAGNKQRIERGYDFTKTIEWFAQRSDLILLFFDSHKLDISDEFKSSIYALKGQEEKIRVILNKSDMVDQQQLMRVYGALMWSLGKVIQTPEVMRVFLGSFWLHRPSNAFEDCRALLEAEQADLLKDLRDLPRNASIRKVNEIVKRARQAKVHAYIIGHLRKEMPTVFGKKSKQRELIKDLSSEFLKVQQLYSVPAGDFPSVAEFRKLLEAYKFENFAKIREPILATAEEALAVDLPRIMSQFHQQNNPLLELTQKNPFLGPPEAFNPLNTNKNPGQDFPPSYWHFASVDKTMSTPIFRSLNPIDGKINGSTAKPYLVSTGLSVEVLAKVWKLADWDVDGYLDEDEFAVALHLIRAVESGGPAILPETLPRSMLPFS